LVQGSGARLNVRVRPLLIDSSLTTVEYILVLVRATGQAVVLWETLPIVAVFSLLASEEGARVSLIAVLEDVELVATSARLSAKAKGVCNRDTTVAVAVEKAVIAGRIA